MSETNDSTNGGEATGIDCRSSTWSSTLTFGSPTSLPRKSAVFGRPTVGFRPTLLRSSCQQDRSATTKKPRVRSRKLLRSLKSASVKTILKPGQSQYRTLSRSSQEDESNNDTGEENAGSTDSATNCKERICRAVLEDPDPIMNLIVLFNLIVLVLETSLPHLDIWNTIEFAMSLLYAAGFLLKIVMFYCCSSDCHTSRQQNRTVEESASADFMSEQSASGQLDMEINHSDGTHQPLMTASGGPDTTINANASPPDDIKAGCHEFWTFWQKFDMVIIIGGMLEVLVFFYHFEHHFQTKWHERLIADITQFMKVLRVCRLYRLIVLFKESGWGAQSPCLDWIRVHWRGFEIGACAVGSAVLLLIMFVMICAMFLVLTVGQVPEDDPDYDIFHNRMGNLWSASITLFQLMVEPNFIEFINLIEYWPPRPIFTLFLILFIVLGNFGFLTMLNGVVSQEITEYNEEYKEKTERIKKREWEDKLQKIHRDTEDLIFGPGVHYTTIENFKNKKKYLAEIFDKAGLYYAERDLDTMLGMLNVNKVDATSEEGVEKADFEYFVEQLVLGMRPMLAMEQFYGIVITKKKVERLESTVSELTSKLDQLLSLQINSAHGRQQGEKTTPEPSLLLENSIPVTAELSS